VQIALLKAVKAISDSAKAQVLLPTIQILLASSPTAADKDSPQLAELSISCFDVSAASKLNDEKNTLWDTFIAVLRGVFKSGPLAIGFLVLALISWQDSYHLREESSPRLWSVDCLQT